MHIGEVEPDEKPDYRVIDSIKFSDEGEMMGQQVFFNPGLNTIIGGRSSGKSVLLGCIERKIDPRKEPKKGNKEYTARVDGFIKDAALLWRGETVSQTDNIIQYYGQSEISDIVRSTKDMNSLVAGIVIKRPDVANAKSILDKSVANNTAAINNKASELYQQKLRVQELDNAIGVIGSRVGIIAEIAKLDNAINALKGGMTSAISPDEEKTHQTLSDRKRELMAKQAEAASDTRLLEAIKNIPLFVSIDRNVAGLSKDMRVTATEFFGKLKEKTTKEWTEFIDAQIKSLGDNNAALANAVMTSTGQDEERMNISANVSVDCTDFNKQWMDICNTHAGKGRSLLDGNVDTNTTDEFIIHCKVVFDSLFDDQMRFKSGNTIQQAISAMKLSKTKFARNYFRVDYNVT